MLLATAPAVGGPTIKEMKERHFEIMRRLVAGELQTDIAHSLNMTDSWISIVIASPVFQVELAKLREVANGNAADVGARLTKLAPDAMSVLERAIRDKAVDISIMQQVSVARDVLDRAGHGKPVAAGAAQVAVKVELVQFAGSIKQEATIDVAASNGGN